MLCVGVMCAPGCYSKSSVFVLSVVCLCFVSDALGDHMVEAYSSTGLVMVLYVASMVFFMFAPLGRGEDLRALVSARSMCLL